MENDAKQGNTVVGDELLEGVDELEQIGEGYFAVVYKGKWKDLSVAIKKPKIEDKNFWHEIKILQ
jgi:predicted Ser/Thr protein kinase